MQAYIAERVLALSARRFRDLAVIGRTTGAEGSITKIAKAKSNQRLQELALALLGADAMAWDAEDAEALEWITQFLRTRANSIEGGTSEIQRNIVGERILGLPREPDAYKGAPWRDVPR
jgi:alkylation response protein AidB-like acyl-CoA dehydrogenase